MAKYRKKPVVIEAEQWFKIGDHSKDKCVKFDNGARYADTEPKFVKQYMRPGSPYEKCKECSKILHIHGWIDTLEGGHIVCPNDWIIKGVKGEFYPCKPDIFEQTYEKVKEKA